LEFQTETVFFYIAANFNKNKTKKIMKQLFLTVLILSYFMADAQILVRDRVFRSQGNPVFRHKYTADPAALVHNNRLYIFAGQDVCPPREHRYVMPNWLVFSTEDMKT
jgi:hypothetical protein